VRSAECVESPHTGELLGDIAETRRLDPVTTRPDRLKQFFGPLPWEGWTYHMVSKLPNDGKDDPALIKPA
jgi:hypothetical protein